MNTAENIKAILIQQINGYRMLMDSLRKEKECLISLNTSEIENITKEKDTITLRIRLLEEERIRLTSRFMSENRIESDMSIQKLAEITGDDSFNSIRLQMISLLQSITELNEFNRILIDRSMNYIKGAIGMLGALGMNIQTMGSSIFSREV